MAKNILEKAKNEVNKNYAFFKKQVFQLKEDHLNEFALLHNEKIIDIYISEDDAIKIGIEKYGDGHFSVQQVNDNSIELGYQSCVII